VDTDPGVSPRETSIRAAFLVLEVARRVLIGRSVSRVRGKEVPMTNHRQLVLAVAVATFLA